MIYTQHMTSRPILYIKSGCPWCDDALTYFSRNGVDVEVRDVLRDEKARSRMKELTGQTLTPSLEYDDFVVADFSVDEFKAELRKHPEMIEKLGIKSV